jgi:hypothetical protein
MKHVCVCIIQHGKSNHVRLSLERSFIVAILMVVIDIDMERPQLVSNRNLFHMFGSNALKEFLAVIDHKNEVAPV